jgi:CRP-like cAMP-binding protein
LQGHDEKPVLLHVLGPGDVFGELALVDEHGTRSASVRALTPGSVRKLERGVFNELRATEPDLDQFLIAIFVGQVRRLSARVNEGASCSATQLVRRRLIALVETFGGANGVEVPLTNVQLAQLAGVSLPVVERVVKAEKAAGTIAKSGKGLTVVELPLLRARAESPEPVT